MLLYRLPSGCALNRPVFFRKQTNRLARSISSAGPSWIIFCSRFGQEEERRRNLAVITGSELELGKQAHQCSVPLMELSVPRSETGGM